MFCRTRSTIRRALSAGAVLTGGLLLSSCTKSLTTLVVEAMDSCIAVRNPAFVAGKGTTALDTPLPPALEIEATKLAYDRAYRQFKTIAESAKNQVTLVCALELAGHYRHGDVAVMLYKFTKHPDAGVAENARKLLAKQDPLPPGFAQ